MKITINTNCNQTVYSMNLNGIHICFTDYEEELSGGYFISNRGRHVGMVSSTVIKQFDREMAKAQQRRAVAA